MKKIFAILFLVSSAALVNAQSSKKTVKVQGNGTGGGESQTLQQTFNTESGGSVLTKNDTVKLSGNKLSVSQGANDALALDPAHDTIALRVIHSGGAESLVKIGDDGSPPKVGLYATTVAGGLIAGSMEVGSGGGGITVNSVPDDRIVNLFAGTASPYQFDFTSIRPSNGKTAHLGIGEDVVSPRKISAVFDITGLTTTSKWELSDTTLRTDVDNYNVYSSNGDAKLLLNNIGLLRLPQYQSSSFFRNDTSNYKILVQDALGNIYKSNWLGGGGGAGVSTGQLTDSLNKIRDSLIKVNAGSIANNDMLKFNSGISRFEPFQLSGTSPITYNNATGQIGINASPTFTNISANSITLPSGTTTANSYALGTDVFLYRTGANQFSIGSTSTRHLDINVGSSSTTVRAIGSGDSALILAAASGNHAAIRLDETALISRNLNDGQSVLSLTQTHASATGNLLTLNNSTGTVAQIKKDGTVVSTKFQLSALNTAPANASDTGTLGEIRIVSGFVYVCVATNTWQRTALTTW